MVRVLPAWDTSAGDPRPGFASASGLKEQHESPSEGLSRAPRPLAAGPARPHPLPTCPQEQIHFHSVHLPPFLPRQGGES